MLVVGAVGGYGAGYSTGLVGSMPLMGSTTAMPMTTGYAAPMTASYAAPMMAAPVVPSQPIVHQEQLVHRHVPVVHEQTVEVPHVQYQEREVQVAKIEYVEKIIEVPQIQTVEKIVEVPQARGAGCQDRVRREDRRSSADPDR